MKLEEQIQQKQSNNTPDRKYANVIGQTRQFTKGMTQQKRFQKALRHVKDALYFRYPRFDAYLSNTSKTFKFCFHLQTSIYWTKLLLFLTYVYLYMIILDTRQHFTQRFTIQSIILTIYWIDVAICLYHQSFETITIEPKPQLRFYAKLIVLCLLTLQLAISTVNDPNNIRSLSPFRFIRGSLPVFYDSLTRKSFKAFLSTYKDLITLVVYYICIILTFSMLGHQFFQIPADAEIDPNKEDYTDFVKSIYITYVNTSYDSFPDNQLPALRWSQWCYVLIITFVLLNMFFFGTIPGTIIYTQFRQTRSKIMLMDEIRQQNSLILAFVTLTQDSLYLQNEVLIRFLSYMYKHKPRFIPHITQIIFKLDQQNAGSIQVGQFMQLNKIITKNSLMFPPQFNDFRPWVEFRHYLNSLAHLNAIVHTRAYKIVSTTVIVMTFVNCLVFLMFQAEEFKILDDIMSIMFAIDMVVRILGLGFEDFFEDKWNQLDFYLVIGMVALEIFPRDKIPHNSDVIIKIFRIFRITELINLLIQRETNYHKYRNSIYEKLRRLMGQTVIIIPIILKFSPLFFIMFYFLGILGMEVFYEAQLIPPTQQYGIYHEFSHFKTFLASQYILVQVLTEAGWSIVTFDYAERTGLYFPVVLYFMTCHAIIVIISASLLRSLIWEAYFTVHREHEQETQRKVQQNQIISQNQKKKMQFTQIRQFVQQNSFVIPNTITKRKFLQHKIDSQILNHLKKTPSKEYISTQQSSGQIQANLNSIRNAPKHGLYSFRSSELLHVQQKDFEEQMQQLAQIMTLNPRNKFTENVTYPTALLDFLKQKFHVLSHEKNKQVYFDPRIHLINSKASLKHHKNQMSKVLGIQRPDKDRRLKIIKFLVDSQLVTEEQIKKYFSRNNHHRDERINSDWIIRKMLLSQYDQEKINRFEIQSLMHIHGQSFGQIRNPCLEPMIKLQALLTYNLRNILRYPNMQSRDFFHIFSAIQDKISNSLLKKGSLFKFVFQIEGVNNTWFTFEFKDSEEVDLHFIKTGLWVYEPNMKQNEIYYGKDFFNWQLGKRPDVIVCEKIIKLLYQSFEGLAFGLMNEEHFFESDPNRHIYDLYSFFTHSSQISRYVKRKLSIQKVMLVILSKQSERSPQSQLDYELSDIILKKQQQRKQYNERDKHIQDFQNLKNLTQKDEQRIIDNEGLPFGYIVNFLKQIKQIMTIHSNSLVHQAEKILNQKFQKDGLDHGKNNLKEEMPQRFFC